MPHQLLFYHRNQLVMDRLQLKSSSAVVRLPNNAAAVCPSHLVHSHVLGHREEFGNLTTADTALVSWSRSI